jgi:hypothetical protein
VTGSPTAGPAIPVRCPNDLGTSGPSASNIGENNCREYGPAVSACKHVASVLAQMPLMQSLLLNWRQLGWVV